MVALIRALLRPNRILLFDEVSFGSRRSRREYEVVECLKQLDLGILLGEQYAERALRAADVVYVLNKGLDRLYR